MLNIRNEFEYSYPFSRRDSFFSSPILSFSLFSNSKTFVSSSYCLKERYKNLIVKYSQIGTVCIMSKKIPSARNTKTRIPIVNFDRCQPATCGHVCMKVCPLHKKSTSKVIYPDKVTKKARI
ncbi:MAG: hypothetical protein ACTSQB_05650, partial [Candidatus Heimdallarchaeota archaeon]